MRRCTIQTYPDCQVLLQTRDQIAHRTNEGVIVADLLGNIVGRPGWSDQLGILSESFAQLNPTATVPWATAPYTVNLNNLSVVRFLKDGTCRFGSSRSPDEGKLDFAGVYITPRSAALDLKINSTALTGSNTEQNWDAVSGEWVSKPQLATDGGMALYNNGTTARCVARSRGTVPANRGHRVDVQLNGFQRSGTAASCRWVFGGEWSVNLIVGQKPRVERQYTTSDGSPVWRIARTMEAAPNVRFGDKYRICVMWLAGRLVVQFENVSIWLLDAANSAAPPTPGSTQNTVKDVFWQEAHWQIETENCRSRVEVAVVKWSSSGGASFTGSLTRAASVSTPIAPGASPSKECAGWRKGGTFASVDASVGTGNVTYALAMTASADGITSPVVDKIIVRWSPTHTAKGNTAIDVRAACDSVKVTLTAPPQAGSTATITLDRTRLDELFPAWENYAKARCPVRIRIKRCGADYSTVFYGYVFRPSRQSGINEERKITITCADEMVCRFQKVGDSNNAPIKQQVPPMDLLFAEKFEGSSGGYDAAGHPPDGSLYAAEIVQEIARIFRGDEFADSMNGNGNPLRYLPADHPPFITVRNDTAGWSQLDAIGGGSPPVSSGDWLIKTPYGQAAFDWWTDLAKDDRCVFYLGHPTSDTSSDHVLIYGRLVNILRAGTTPLWKIYDVAKSGDWVRLAQSVEVEQRPEKYINCVEIWGPESDGLDGILPSMRIGTARLPSDDDRSADKTWESDFIQRTPYALLGAEAIAQGIISLLQYVHFNFATFNFEGDERVGVGHIVTPDFSGAHQDTSLGVDDQLFRVEQVTHDLSFTQGGANYQMTVVPRPLSYLEDQAYRESEYLVDG